MRYVIGIDLGTSAVKVILVNSNGDVCKEVSKSYPLIQLQSGYSEQDPEEWVEKTLQALAELVKGINASQIEGLSFSGQMHGLVLLDRNDRVIRPAILWNDTRTTKQCQLIKDTLGEKQLLKITKNPALEGFTLPKLLWVREHEYHNYKMIKVILLPKDYLRFRLTGTINMEYSDAAGTLILDVSNQVWSKEVCSQLEINEDLLPHLVDSHELTGNITKEIAESTGLSTSTKVFAGGADNACGAIGAGILEEGNTLCSIGTSGVVLSYEKSGNQNFGGKVHYFNHAKKNAYYTMGVTLSAGSSLSWFKEIFNKELTFNELLEDIDQVPLGSNGLLFTPYLYGERTPFADANIRGSFIGIDASHTRQHFARSVIEGITFSLNETIQIFRQEGKKVDQVIAIGGGAKSKHWLQIQADVFNAEVIKLKSEQGPAMGAAILAAFGCGWYQSLDEGAQHILKPGFVCNPIKQNVEIYQDLFLLYQSVYQQTRELNQKLVPYRKIEK